MEETGIVTRTNGIMATVAIKKTSSCDNCNAKDACSTTSDGAELEAMNPVQAKVGQTVKISMKPYTYLKGTMLLYGIPMVVLIAGAIVGKNIGVKYITNMNSDLVAAIVGFSALGLSLLAIKAWSTRAESKTEYKPVIEQIIE
jgi:sigma-E factor negative regulatory protein RseC